MTMTVQSFGYWCHVFLRRGQRRTGFATETTVSGAPFLHLEFYVGGKVERRDLIHCDCVARIEIIDRAEAEETMDGLAAGMRQRRELPKPLPEEDDPEPIAAPIGMGVPSGIIP